jgi:hypothetical protein
MVFRIEEVRGNGPSICHQSYPHLTDRELAESRILSPAQTIEYKDALDMCFTSTKKSA